MTGGPYYSKPQSFYKSGIARDLSATAFRIYDFLWYAAQQRSTRRMQYTASAVARETGISVRAVVKCSAELVKASLVVQEGRGVGGTIYHLTDPETGRLWHENPREILVAKQSGRLAGQPKKTSSVKHGQVVKSSRTATTEKVFRYGPEFIGENYSEPGVGTQRPTVRPLIVPWPGDK